MEEQFLYKAWANSELLDKIGLICKEEYLEKWVMAIRLLNHTCIVDRIFIAHIEFKHNSYDSTNTAITPSIDELKKDIKVTDDWLIQYVKKLEHSTLDQKLRFSFTDGGRGCMSVREILNHLIIHGAYHRGNIGMLLTACGIERPDDTFTRFLHDYDPRRRMES